MTQVKSESMPQFRLRLFFLIFFWINPFTWILIPCSVPVFCFGALLHTVRTNDLRNLGAVSVLAVIMAVKLKPYENRSRLHFRTVAWLSDVIYSTPKSKQSLDLWHSSEIASQMKWKKMMCKLSFLYRYIQSFCTNAGKSWISIPIQHRSVDRFLGTSSTLISTPMLPKYLRLLFFHVSLHRSVINFGFCSFLLRLPACVIPL